MKLFVCERGFLLQTYLEAESLLQSNPDSYLQHSVRWANGLHFVEGSQTGYSVTSADLLFASAGALSLRTEAAATQRPHLSMTCSGNSVVVFCNPRAWLLQ